MIFLSLNSKMSKCQEYILNIFKIMIGHTVCSEQTFSQFLNKVGMKHICRAQIHVAAYTSFADSKKLGSGLYRLSISKQQTYLSYCTHYDTNFQGWCYLPTPMGTQAEV